MRFAIFTHVEHLEQDRQYYAYAPYVREMNLWLRHVEEVEVVGTRGRRDWGTWGQGKLKTRRPGENVIAYEHSKLTFTEVPSFDFLKFFFAVKAIIRIPSIFFKIMGAMHRADHMHLRCPGNIGLLACVCQIFFPSKPKSAKYAGNWDPEAKQPWTYRLQKGILSNTFLTRNMQVLVYGEWPGQSKNIVPFFTATFSEEEKAEVPKKTFSEPFTFLFVGNLVEGKRPLEAVRLVEAINAEVVQNRAPKIRTSLEIYGDGPEREKLETYVREKRIEQFIIFKGSRTLEELKKAFKKSHFVILPSKSEGWPKAIAEAMFYGCIPIATPVSCVPWMLADGSRGILVSEKKFDRSRVDSGKWTVDSDQELEGKKEEWSVVNGQWSEDLHKIVDLIYDQERMETMSEAARKWSQQYTLERFEEAIKELLNNKK